MTDTSRRKLIKTLAAGGGITVAPSHWKTPVVNSLMLPAHAQTTLPTDAVCSVDPGLTAVCPDTVTNYYRITAEGGDCDIELIAPTSLDAPGVFLARVQADPSITLELQSEVDCLSNPCYDFGSISLAACDNIPVVNPAFTLSIQSTDSTGTRLFEVTASDFSSVVGVSVSMGLITVNEIT